MIGLGTDSSDAITLDGYEHGFVGDGVTDNLSAFSNIQALISAGSNRSYILKLRRGTYIVSNSAALSTPNFTVQGDGGKNAVTIKLSSAVAGSHGVFDITATNVQISGVTIDASTLINWAIYGNSANTVYITDVTVKNTTDHGLYFTLCNDVTLTRVTADTCGTANNAAGFFTSNCNNLSLIGCMSKNSFQHGYYLLGAGATSLTMTACRAFSNGGIGISPRYSQMDIVGCHSWGNVSGAFSSSYAIEPSTKGSRANVSSCIFGGSTGAVPNEVSILGIDNYVFGHNYVETSNASGAGILFSTLNELTCSGNQIVSKSAATPPTAGIKLTGVTGFLIASNTIVGGGTTGGNAIYVDTTSSGLVAVNRIDTWNTGATISATACNDVRILWNEILNVTTLVSNSTTGTNCMVLGNDPPGSGVVLRDAHLVSLQTTSPTLLAQASAGTAPPAPVFDTTSLAPTDERCVIELGTGTAPSAGDQVRLTFNIAFGTSNRPVVMVEPYNQATALLQPYVSAANSLYTVIAFANAPAASQPINTYRLGVTVRG